MDLETELQFREVKHIVVLCTAMVLLCLSLVSMVMANFAESTLEWVQWSLITVTYAGITFVLILLIDGADDYGLSRNIMSRLFDPYDEPPTKEFERAIDRMEKEDGS